MFIVFYVSVVKHKHEGSGALETTASQPLFLSPCFLSPFCAADVRDPARAEEPHGSTRRRLRRQGQGRLHQLHHGGLEGVRVQHLALGANSQVSSAPPRRRHLECV